MESNDLEAQRLEARRESNEQCCMQSANNEGVHLQRGFEKEKAV
jgi:hypothetical protein